MKPRYTHDFDPSPNDILRQFNGQDQTGKTVGCYSTDIDNLQYSIQPHGRRRPVCFIDWKHRNIPALDLDEESIRAQYDLATYYLFIPFFVAITYTKPGEQEIPMFYLIARNLKAETIMKEKWNKRHLFVSPYMLAELMFDLRDIPFPLSGNCTKLSKTIATYPIPKLIGPNYI